MLKPRFAGGRIFERPLTNWFTEDDMPLRARKRTVTDADPSGASDENSFTAAAKSLLTRVKTLLASSGRPVVSLPIDAGVISELTELFVRMAEQWATITDDQKDAFDAICVAIQRDPCEMRRLVWKQRFHRILATELCDQDTRQDSRCQLCGAEVSTPSVCPKAPLATDVWKPRPGDVIWIHGEDRPPYMAIATIAGELTPLAPAPLYRKQQFGIAGFISYALRARDRIDECIGRWPQYEPAPDLPTTCASTYLQDRDGHFYPACNHRNRSKLHSELIPRNIRDTSQTPLALAITEAARAGTLSVLDLKLHRLDSAIRAYAGCLLKSNDSNGIELLELNEAINALAPYANTGAASLEQGDQRTPRHEEWLTVTACAELLLTDVPALNIKKARARVSDAANKQRFQTNGKKGLNRRIEPISFDAWRLKQRDRDLDNADR